MAERLVWSKYPHWKRDIIINCRINSEDDRILSEYAREIVDAAENLESTLSESYPPLPEIKKQIKAVEVEVEPMAINPS